MTDSTTPLHVLISVSACLLLSFLTPGALEPQSLAYLLSCFPASSNVDPSLSACPSPIHPSDLSLNVISSVKAFVISNLNSLNAVTILFMCLGSGFAFICICMIGDANGFRKITKFKMRKCYPLFRKTQLSILIVHFGKTDKTLM